MQGGYKYILVIVDHFTLFAQAYPTTSKSAKTVADRLFNDYALRFGFPRRIHYDQGGEFENQLLAEFLKESWCPQFQNNSVPPARERSDGTIQQDLTSNAENTDRQAEDKLEGFPE